MRPPRRPLVFTDYRTPIGAVQTGDAQSGAQDDQPRSMGSASLKRFHDPSLVPGTHPTEVCKRCCFSGAPTCRPCVYPMRITQGVSLTNSASSLNYGLEYPFSFVYLEPCLGPSRLSTFRRVQGVLRMMRAVRLGIIHRNRLFRECLASVLSEDDRFQVTDLDHRDPDYLKGIEEQGLGMVLIDLNLPEQLAVGLTQQIRQCAARVKVILLAQTQALLSHGAAEDLLVECLAAGAHGCVLEQSSLQELQTAIQKVIAGERFYSPEIIPSMCYRLAESVRASSWRERVKSLELTPRELQVVSLIADGLSNKQIARRLSLSLYTVKNHVHNVVEKLQVESRFKAVEYARQRGWLEKLKVLGSAGTGG
jgi:DNA-binding NarL/FixJ family response regulator